MIKIVTVENMRAIEAAADAAGTSYDQMMENAGRAMAIRVMQLAEKYDEPRITILIGPGNNGGDGLVTGRIVAAESTAQVRFYLLKARAEDDPKFKPVRDAGLFVAVSEDDHDGRVLKNMIASADIVIDALFGIGIRLPLREQASRILRTTHRVVEQRKQIEPEVLSIDPIQPEYSKRPPAPMVLAVDCPSGLDCDTGELDTNALQADETMTFIAAKPGLITFPGANAVGRLHVASAGVPNDLPELAKNSDVFVDADYVKGHIPERPANSHKGTFGKALVVAGCINYIGAPGLASRAAYRAGAGLVTIGTAKPLIPILASTIAEPTWLLLDDEDGAIAEGGVSLIHQEWSQYNAMLVGPGMGRAKPTQKFIRSLLKSDMPPALVVDADGLNMLSDIEEWWERLPPRTIITPHEGEMARLAGLKREDISNNRRAIAREKAAEWQVILVLKGAHTLIAAPDGSMAVLPFKNDALATAGTGDVLAGTITGLLAQHLKPFEAAVIGGYLHGLSGEIASKKHGSRSVIASDVIESLAAAYQQLTQA